MEKLKMTKAEQIISFCKFCKNDYDEKDKAYKPWSSCDLPNLKINENFVLVPGVIVGGLEGTCTDCQLCLIGKDGKSLLKIANYYYRFNNSIEHNLKEANAVLYDIAKLNKNKKYLIFTGFSQDSDRKIKNIE